MACPDAVLSFLAAEMKHNDKAMCIMHDREQRHRKQLCREINDYQQNFQKPETRREFDLSDPLALKKELPARVSDNDMRNTISGMQKFMGEDLNFQERKRIQKEQNREWCLQQYGEWEKARADQKLAGNEREDEKSAPPSSSVPVDAFQSPTNITIVKTSALGVSGS